jgi:hypothetical protein
VICLYRVVLLTVYLSSGRTLTSIDTLSSGGTLSPFCVLWEDWSSASETAEFVSFDGSGTVIREGGGGGVMGGH